MAEATRTLSLENDAIYEPGDELWMGHSIIPRDVACCETTVNLPSFLITAAADGDMKKSAFVVNDLTKHPDLSTRPYVTGYPHGRFYAGVPITTSSGVNIGAYCILDDKVRDGVSDEELIFLRDMSQTVMTHLETVRALFERQQTNRMVAGLGEYVRGAADAGNKAPRATNLPLNQRDLGALQTRKVEYRLPDALVDPIRTPTTTSSQSVKEYFAAQHHPAPSAGNSQLPESSTVHVQQSGEYSDSSSTSIQERQSHVRQEQTDTSSAPRSTVSPVGSSTALPPPRKSEDTNDPKRTYQRAAEILCQSLDIDGVAFLDTSVQTFGGLSEAQYAEGGTVDSDDSAGGLSLSDSATESQAKFAKVCEVLGCAQTLPNDPMEPNHPQSQPTVKLTESFLRTLMRRNPHGKVWTFDEDFKTHSGDGFSSDESGADRGLSSPSTQQRKAARKDRQSDGQILQSAFPGSRCIALHGIWDYTRRRWAVAGLYWTLDPLRHIAKDTDMQFVATFCDIIVAETKRLEVLGTDKAKSDFISTVSHELRSPLHGILGSCELLSDYGLDDTATAFLEQIDSCGRTLLEIIEHLLDFADLKSQRLRKGTVKSSRIGRKLLPPIENSPANDLKALDTSVALDDLTEDAVVSSVYSFYYGQSADQHTKPPVILDIDRSSGKPWHCSLATGGWKRVCINLVTNALKYTPSGFIRVSLKQEPKPGSRRRFDAVLTVSDTGKGMSKKFQSDHLFHDFAQEDTLSDGLGLGMHMVSRIVYAMGGKIEVVSDQEGSGTCVTVHVPLEHEENSQNRIDAWNQSSVTAPRAFEGLKIGLVTGMHPPANLDDSPTPAVSAMAIASIENNLKFLGIQSERCKWQRVKPYDLMIVLEAEIAEYLAALRVNRTGDDAGVKTTTGSSVTEQAPADAGKLPSSDADKPPMQSPLAEAPLAHVLSRRVSASQTDTNVPSAMMPAPEPLLIEAPVTSAFPTTTKTPVLLLVDDNIVNLKLLATFAKKYKYPHITAQHGQLAVDAFVNAHKNTGSQRSSGQPNTGTLEIGIPNIILMDINMPVMDGYEAVQRIRSYEKKHRMTASKIIAVTALQSEAAQAEAFGSGFDMFLSKPIKLKDLAKLIDGF
ncbi:hypothetical protein N0V86_005446 [Didymella sp. IMI 355093]|nr:hypothetical protein N0V86_005446 [Didymella sp. IMI 355093]